VKLATRLFLAAIFVLFAALPPQVYARGHHAQQESGVGVIAVAELPVEARETLRAIKHGGPFAYDRDGVVFKNFERVLPQRSRGYYHEYTVKTPGASNRGARRIISGETNEYYYTADHYQTFKRIRE
jgi:ribonuclease T1